MKSQNDETRKCLQNDLDGKTAAYEIAAENAKLTLKSDGIQLRYGVAHGKDL